MGRTRDRRSTRSRVVVTVALPEGVSAADWALERVARQNPRIRALLAVIRALESVRESNYAILHCSPRRMQEIWDQLRQAATALRTEVAPLLAEPSPVPDLEAAREAAELGLAMLDRTLLTEIDRHPAEVPRDDGEALRKLACVAIGKLLDFLQDTFGNLMAADPRSQHDADYFLSRSFARDIDEAEWLHEAVVRLEGQVAALEADRTEALARALRALATGRQVPDGAAWTSTDRFLGRLVDELVPEIRRVRGLRGIRLDELELLSGYAAELPELCRCVVELRLSALAAAARLETAGAAGVAAVHAVFADRLGTLIARLDDQLRDLAAFMPLWRRGVEQRRALLLRERSAH